MKQGRSRVICYLTAICIGMMGLFVMACVHAPVSTASTASPAPFIEAEQEEQLASVAPQYSLPYGETLDARIQAFVDEQQVTGLAAAIVDNGETMFLNYGLTDANGTAITEHTRFEIGSITKLFTSVLLAAMSAEENSNINPDSPVQDYVDFPIPVYVDGTEILFWHLATHTSGLPRMPLNCKNSLNPYADYSLEKLRAYFEASSTLNAKPGKSYAYSNLGVGLMGVALTNAAGLAYDGSRGLETLYRQYIWDVLGMDSTALILDSAQEAARAMPHTQFGTKARAWDFDALAGCGAIKSTTHDLALFMKVAMGQIETQPLLKEAFAMAVRERFRDGSTAIGLGFHLLQYAGDTYLWHNGITGGYQSAMLFSPDSGKGIVILCNHNVDVLELAQKSLPYMK